MKSIYETKSYKLILSYYTNTKLHKNIVFSKMITFNIVEFNGTKCDYFITIMLDYNIINKTIKKNKEKSFDFKDFGIWEFHCIDEEENGISITYVHKRINYFITINIYILKDIENEISFNTYNGYDSMYAPLFYNEYKQLLYHDYFIGE